MKLKRFLLSISYVILAACLANHAFAQSEPPVWKSSLPSLSGRSATLLRIDEKRGHVVYAVKYADPNFRSEAVLDLGTKAMLREAFKGRWLVVYEYSSITYKNSHLPTRFAVHEYSEGGEPGKVINVYAFEKAIGNGKLRYVDKDGNKRVIHCLYFEIVPFDPF